MQTERKLPEKSFTEREEQHVVNWISFTKIQLHEFQRLNSSQNPRAGLHDRPRAAAFAMPLSQTPQDGFQQTSPERLLGFAPAVESYFGNFRR